MKLKSAAFPVALFAGMLFLTSCSDRPEETSIKNDSARIIQEYIHSKIHTQMKNNPEHKIFHLGKNQILIISEGVPKALPEPLPSSVNFPIHTANHYDAILFEYSSGEVSWGEITRLENKNLYQMKLKARITQNEYRFLDSKGIEIVSFTPEEWTTLSQEKKNLFVLERVKKLPAAEFDYDKILSKLPTPIAYQENALLTLNWDKEKKRWNLSEQNLNTAKPNLPDLQTGKKDERTKKLVAFMNGGGFFLKNNVWCTPADHENLDKFNAGQRYLNGQWHSRQTIADTFDFKKDFAQLNTQKHFLTSSTFDEKVLGLLEKYPRLLPEIRSEALSAIEKSLVSHIKSLKGTRNIGQLERLQKKLNTNPFTLLPDTCRKEIETFLRKHYDEQKSIRQKKAEKEKQYAILESLLKNLFLHPGYVRYGSLLKNCKIPENDSSLKNSLNRIYLLNVFAGNNKELQEKYKDTKIGKSLIEVCSSCDGSGKASCSSCHGSGRCRSCGGRGKVESNSLLREGVLVSCRDCRGGVCSLCNGSGKVPCSKCRYKGISFDKGRAIRELKYEIRNAQSLIRSKSGKGFHRASSLD